MCGSLLRRITDDLVQEEAENGMGTAPAQHGMHRGLGTARALGSIRINFCGSSCAFLPYCLWCRGHLWGGSSLLAFAFCRFSDRFRLVGVRRNPRLATAGVFDVLAAAVVDGIAPARSCSASLLRVPRWSMRTWMRPSSSLSEMYLRHLYHTDWMETLPPREEGSFCHS